MNKCAAKLGRFAGSLLLGLALGRAIGGLLDAGLWEISYDYVFPDDCAGRHGIRLGLFLGALYGAAATITTRPCPSWRRLPRDAALGGLISVFGGGVCGLVGWGLVKTGYGEGLDAGLALTPRHTFCVLWFQGTAALAWLTTIGLMLAVWRARLPAAATTVIPAQVGPPAADPRGAPANSP